MKIVTIILTSFILFSCSKKSDINSSLNQYTSGSQIITTIAGNGIECYSGDGGLAIDAELSFPYGIAVDASKNIYITDYHNNCIRKVTASTGVINIIAGKGIPGFSGDDGQATSAQLNYPKWVALDASGNIYIVDGSNNRIRKVTASTGIITTIAGNGEVGYSGDGGPALSASFNGIFAVAVDASGNVFISESSGRRVRKVTASTGNISTIARGGNLTMDGELATMVALQSPGGIALDATGNIYIADFVRICKVNSNTGILNTIAGNSGSQTSNFGDGGAAISAEVHPCGITIDAIGNIYISDIIHNRIRKINSTTGLISTIPGYTVTSGYSGDGDKSTLAQLNSPFGIAIDVYGNIYFSDLYNNRVRKISK